MDENYVYFTLPDGRTVTVPRAEGGSEPQPSVPHILYAVGQELVPGQGHYYATLWKDGKRQLLTDGSADSFCNGVYVDGNKVYVVGCEAIGDLFDDGYYEPYPLNVGVMWQFEVGNETQVTRSVLSDGKRATSPSPSRRRAKTSTPQVSKRWKTPTERPSTGVTGRWST